MQDSDVEAGVWAVVTDAGGKKYIGQIDTSAHKEMEVWEVLGSEWPIHLTNAWAYIEMDLPIGGPNGQMGIQHITHCRPTNNCQGASSFYIMATAVHLLDDMEAADRKRNKELVEQVAQTAMKARAGRSGIQLAPAGAIPPGPPRGFHGPGRSS